MFSSCFFSILNPFTAGSHFSAFLHKIHILLKIKVKFNFTKSSNHLWYWISIFSKLVVLKHFSKFWQFSPFDLGALTPQGQGDFQYFLISKISPQNFPLTPLRCMVTRNDVDPPTIQFPISLPSFWAIFGIGRTSGCGDLDTQSYDGHCPSTTQWRG